MIVNVYYFARTERQVSACVRSNRHETDSFILSVCRWLLNDDGANLYLHFGAIQKEVLSYRRTTRTTTFVCEIPLNGFAYLSWQPQHHQTTTIRLVCLLPSGIALLLSGFRESRLLRHCWW